MRRLLLPALLLVIFAALAYLVASVCFVLALRGLSHPETSRSGNLYGMVGMAIAIVTTLLLPGVVSYWLIIFGIAVINRKPRRGYIRPYP